MPIVYRFDSLERRDLLALYRAADVALVTPLNDGMNLVAKEFVAASVDGRGVLVLSTFAGAAEELSTGAIEVNPNDIEAVAEAIHQAATMPADEQRARLQRMQDRVREYDVHAWVRAYLAPPRRRGPSRRARPGGTSPAVSSSGAEYG